MGTLSPGRGKSWHLMDGSCVRAPCDRAWLILAGETDAPRNGCLNPVIQAITLIFLERI